jgi:hypothetical protein
MSELTRGRSGRLGFLGLAFVLAVALVAVLLQGPATGTSHVEVTEDAGILLLSTGPEPVDNYIEYYQDAVIPESPGVGIGDLGALTASRSIEVSRQCDVTNLNVIDTEDTEGDNARALLSIDDSGGTRNYPGLVSNGFGVKTKNNCSTSQGRIVPGQTLTLALGGYFVDEVAIDMLEVDIEGKFNAELSVSLDGIDLPNELLPDGDSDNGPDSGPSDNTLVTIGGDGVYSFHTVTFGPGPPDSSAEVSIEGGGDGTVTGGTLRTHFGVNQTLFRLVTTKTYDGDLACGTSVTESDGGVAATEVEVSRLANKDNECEEITPTVLYNLDIEDTSVLFDPDLSTETDALFLVRIDWAPTIDPFEPLTRKISLSGDLGDLEDIVACASLLQDPVDGTPVNPDPDPADTIQRPDGTPWCLAGQRQELLSDGTWQQIQWYYGGGDPRWQ